MILSTTGSHSIITIASVVWHHMCSLACEWEVWPLLLKVFTGFVPILSNQMWCVPGSQLFWGLLRWGRSVTPCLFIMHSLCWTSWGIFGNFSLAFWFLPAPCISEPQRADVVAPMQRSQSLKPTCHTSCSSRLILSDAGWWSWTTGNVAGHYGKGNRDVGMAPWVLKFSCPELRASWAILIIWQ